ncbi:Golgi-associated plant pathogenesis-related protein 1-like [Bolinopsis microptera]|uniref:Golgi-associated plant pathogenesis-related protein 1-like n=1 Tax=Bolinopsis microptera TaxID=2820187 RepID=UPI00307A4E93
MFASLPTKPHRQLQNGMAGEKCARCGKAASLAPCYTRPDTGEMYHYQCIMISLPLEKPIALEKATNPNSLGEFERVGLEQHNRLRALHHSPPLTWSNKLEDHAKKWVAHLLKLNEGRSATEMELQHDSYQGMGECLYVQYCGSTLSAYEAGTRVTNNWYSEEDEFDYDANEFTHDTSHFSQVVWKGSWKIGMATAQIGNTFVTVANYWPAGNIQSWFIDNVLRK